MLCSPGSVPKQKLAFSQPHREEEPCPHPSSSAPLVADKESPGEKGKWRSHAD